MARTGLRKLPVRGCTTRVETKEPLIALTFDDGPDPEFTPRLLDLLEKHDARGTFFMLGSAAAQHPDLVSRVGEEGHAIGNHTWDHPAVSRISWKEIRWQIRKCQEALHPCGLRLFRPPYLALSKLAVLTSRALGYEVIMANLDSGDWWNPSGPEIAEHLLANAAAGDIILLHDGLAGFAGRRLSHEPLPDRSAMLEGLDRFLTDAGEQFRFVTVPVLIESGRAVRHRRYSKGPAPVRPE